MSVLRPEKKYVFVIAHSCLRRVNMAGHMLQYLIFSIRSVSEFINDRSRMNISQFSARGTHKRYDYSGLYVPQLSLVSTLFLISYFLTMKWVNLTLFIRFFRLYCLFLNNFDKYKKILSGIGPNLKMAIFFKNLAFSLQFLCKINFFD